MRNIRTIRNLCAVVLVAVTVMAFTAEKVYAWGCLDIDEIQQGEYEYETCGPFWEGSDDACENALWWDCHYRCQGASYSGGFLNDCHESDEWWVGWATCYCYN